MKDSQSDKIKQIKSDSLREIAIYLSENGIKITYFGRSWSKVSADWIYFDTKLDLDCLKRTFNLKDNIMVHENLDPKSGTERGLIDKITHEGLMGKLC